LNSLFLKNPPPLETLTPTTTVTRIITYTWETIQSFGPGTVYTPCDGIPRFNFLGPPTSSQLSTILVYKSTALTLWGRKLENMTKSTTISAANEAIERPQPTCKPTVDECDRLWGAFQNRKDEMDVGTDLAGKLVEPPFLCRYFPECTVDVGSEVVLLYWPPLLTSRDICNKAGYTATTINRTHTPLPLITTAITFNGQDLYLRPKKVGNMSADIQNGYIPPSVMYGNFTFHYPTVYLAHHAITATVANMVDRSAWDFRITNEINSRLPFTDFGFNLPESLIRYLTTKVRPPGIIPLSSEDVFSIKPIFKGIKTAQMDAVEFAQLIAKGKLNTEFIPAVHEWETYPFDFGHLQNPVPASVYYNARYRDCFWVQSHCGTITDDSYRPQLFIKSPVWNQFVPKDLNCEYPMLNDPPKQLVQIPVTTLDMPTISIHHVQTPQAFPGGSPATALSAPTGTAQEQNFESRASGKGTDRGGKEAINPHGSDPTNQHTQTRKLPIPGPTKTPTVFKGEGMIISYRPPRRLALYWGMYAILGSILY
jgi:hypothetical protein